MNSMKSIRNTAPMLLHVNKSRIEDQHTARIALSCSHYCARLAQGRKLLTKRKQAASQVVSDAPGFLAPVPPVPLGNGLAFPEFATALRARQQAEAAEKSRARGRRGTLLTHDEDEGGAQRRSRR